MNHISCSLTIGMIVKNEIAQLETCLSGLQPLREALDCQLILTDTGSTDGTQALAKKYADLFLEFDWCDDFAKARNTGVDHATGRWFLYVDADHVFDESLLEIVSFLSLPQVDDLYDSASVTLLNYTGSRENLTGSFTQQRPLLVNFSKGRRYFQHRIHESIPVHPHATYTLPTTITHWGYLDHEKESKTNRNRILLRKIVEEDPLNLKHQFQLIKEVDCPKEKKELLLSAIALGAKDSPPDPRLFLLQTHLLALARSTKDWSLFWQTQETCQDFPPHSVIQCNLLGLCTQAALEQNRTLEALTFFGQYRPLFLQLQECPDSQYGMLDSYFYAQEGFYATLEEQILSLLQQLQRKEEGIALLSQSRGLSYAIAYEQVPLFSAYLSLMSYFQPSPLWAECYLSFKKKPHLLGLFYNAVTQEPLSPSFYETFSPLPEDTFTLLCQVQVKGISSLSPSQIQGLLAEKNHFGDPFFAPLVDALLFEETDPFSLLTHCTIEELLAHSKRQLSEERIPALLERLSPSSFSSLAHEKFLALAGFSVVDYLIRQDKLQIALSLFPVFCQKINLYLGKVYCNPRLSQDLLSPEESLALAYDDYLHSNHSFSALETLHRHLTPFPSFSLSLIPSHHTFTPLQIETKEEIFRLLQQKKPQEAQVLAQKYNQLFPEDILDLLSQPTQ